MNDTVKEEQQRPREVFAILVERGHIVDVRGFLASVPRISIRLSSIYSKKKGVIWYLLPFPTLL